MEEEVLNTKEAAKYMKASKGYLLKMVKEAQLPCFRVGRKYRFTISSLNRWIKDRLKLNQPCKKLKISYSIMDEPT